MSSQKLKCEEQKEIYDTVKDTRLYSYNLQSPLKSPKTRHYDSGKATLKKLEKLVILTILVVLVSSITQGEQIIH